MAEAAITAVLCKLGELAVREASILLQVGEDITLLRDRLPWLQALVRETDRKRRAGTIDGLTLVSVRQKQQVAFEAEDALDEFFYDKVIGPKDQGCSRYWKVLRRYLTCLCTKVVVRHGLAGQIKIINSRLDQILENEKEYNIKHTPLMASASSTTAIAAWRDDLENAVGFDKDIEILMNMLLPPLNEIKKMRPTRHEHGPRDQMSIDGKMAEASGAEENKNPVAIPKDGEMIQASGAGEKKHPVAIPKDGEMIQASGAGEKKHPVPIPQDEEIVEASGAQENKQRVPVSIDEEIVEVSGAKENIQPVPMSKNKEIVEVNNGGIDKDLIFISVFGDSGAGKNTLVKNICRQMRSEVEILLWHHMEPGSSPAHLLEKVYKALRYGKDVRDENDVLPTKNEEIMFDISAKLRHFLSGKRYMLILGGISSKTILNSIRPSLPDNGGKVILIVDTENEEVAWHANTMNRDGINRVHQLTRLDPPRSAELFFWKVFRKGQEKISSNAEGYARYERLVHEITGGYPMAIVLLAGLLRFKERHIQWDSVLQQLKTTLLPSSENSRQTKHLCLTRRPMEIIFWESFEDLPSDLKSCYLYFAAYPKDTRQYADDIVRMWIGEGFIKPQNGRTLEQVGHSYLKELVLRSLVEVEEMKADGGIQLVRVHKSLIEFLAWELRESGFMGIINGNDIHDAFVPALARRLSVQSDSGSRYATKQKFPKMRSFICRVGVTDDSQSRRDDLEFLGCSKFIQVISVQGLGLNKLPDQIGDMINLRYLRIGCRSLLLLPPSIAKLFNLQTLDIRNTQVRKIHQDFWKIKTLRHVLARNLELPTTISVVLAEDESGGGGSELQTLHGVEPVWTEQWSAGNCPLNRMTRLRSLEMNCFVHEKHHGPAFEAALGNMPLLGHLKLAGDEIPSCVFTDPSLRSLQTMVLCGTVRWGDITTDADLLRRFRPNLVQLKLDLHAIREMKRSMKKQLGDMILRL